MTLEKYEALEQVALYLARVQSSLERTKDWANIAEGKARIVKGLESLTNEEFETIQKVLRHIQELGEYLRFREPTYYALQLVKDLQKDEAIRQGGTG